MTDTQTQPKSAKFVTVACKLPNGLQLQLQESYKDTEQTLVGSREVVRHRKVGEVITVAGCAQPVGMPSGKTIVGGYALTRNVPADFWDKWLEQNKDSPVVKNQIIFATPSRDGTESQAKEQKKVTSGLEPLDPTFKMEQDGRIIPNDPRYPRALSGVSAIHTGERA